MKDVKLVADVSEQPITDYTTFWGKIKGQLEKQTDLYEWLQRLYNNITELFKERLILSNRVDKIENITVDDEERNIKDIHLESDYLEYDLNALEESSESSEEFINNIKVPTKEYVDNKHDALEYNVDTLDADFSSHEENTDIHTNLEEKELWNSKATSVEAGEGISTLEISPHVYQVTNIKPDKTFKVIVQCEDVVSGLPSTGRSNTTVDEIISAINTGKFVYVYVSYGMNEIMISPLTCITTVSEMVDGQEVYETVAVFTFNHQTGGYGVDWKYAYADLIIHENKFVKFEWKKHFVEEE